MFHIGEIRSLFSIVVIANFLLISRSFAFPSNVTRGKLTNEVSSNAEKGKFHKYNRTKN